MVGIATPRNPLHLGSAPWPFSDASPPCSSAGFRSCGIARYPQPVSLWCLTDSPFGWALPPLSIMPGPSGAGHCRSIVTNMIVPWRSQLTKNCLVYPRVQLFQLSNCPAISTQHCTLPRRSSKATTSFLAAANRSYMYDIYYKISIVIEYHDIDIL